MLRATSSTSPEFLFSAWSSFSPCVRRKLRTWFSENLEKPTSFGPNKLRLGICWFKTGSAEHISRIREMVHILERNDAHVKKIRTDKPGYAIYEEEWQEVAEPLRNGTMPRKQGIPTRPLSPLKLIVPG